MYLFILIIFIILFVYYFPSNLITISITNKLQVETGCQLKINKKGLHQSLFNVIGNK